MNVLSPFVQFFVGAVALLSAMVTVDRLYHYYVTAYFKWIIRKDPLDDFPGTPLPTDMVCTRSCTYTCTVPSVDRDRNCNSQACTYTLYTHLLSHVLWISPSLNSQAPGENRAGAVLEAVPQGGGDTANVQRGACTFEMFVFCLCGRSPPVTTFRVSPDAERRQFRHAAHCSVNSTSALTSLILPNEPLTSTSHVRNQRLKPDTSQDTHTTSHMS